jgi:hypothetical protein
MTRTSVSLSLRVGAPSIAGATLRGRDARHAEAIVAYPESLL